MDEGALVVKLLNWKMTFGKSCARRIIIEILYRTYSNVPIITRDIRELPTFRLPHYCSTRTIANDNPYHITTSAVHLRHLLTVATITATPIILRNDNHCSSISDWISRGANAGDGRPQSLDIGSRSCNGQWGRE